MTFDIETWIIETGATVIQKLHDDGPGSLTSLERAVYRLWEIDYAVCNSGSFGPLADMDSTAIRDLHAFASESGFVKLREWLEFAENEEEFCHAYFERIVEASSELRAAYSR